VPFLSRSQHVIREFALLTTVSTIAMSVNLLFVSLFSLGQFASFALSLFVSIGVYVGSRQWLVNQLLDSSLPSAERMFERLYRVAREVEEHPERTPRLLSRLLQELFEPLELKIVQKTVEGTRVIDDGSTLLLPIPILSATQDPEPVQQSMLLRFAHRGRRLFTLDDVRLTDRIIEQLARAVAYDKAVERGRSEERSRLAQDLHDDIGARLLTLMYTAPTPEIEEYARHTLQDLKTLTRGLAAANHRLSHAAAEWKSDLSQRLSAAHIELDWQCEFDTDTQLNVVQWSALTRIMRELINNVIAHAGARKVQVHFRLFQQQMMLQVSDNGSGRTPQNWSHGLGLGGIRKRAKQLGASVEWLEATPRGIICRVLAKEWGPLQPSLVKFDVDKSQRWAEQPG
jgi:signal transduction histidine kinase